MSPSLFLYQELAWRVGDNIRWKKEHTTWGHVSEEGEKSKRVTMPLKKVAKEFVSLFFDSLGETVRHVMCRCEREMFGLSGYNI